MCVCVCVYVYVQIHAISRRVIGSRHPKNWVKAVNGVR